MNRVLFTKKHITFSLIIGCVILLFVVGFWLFLISPKMVKVAEAKKSLISSQAEITTVNQTLSELKNLPQLIESNGVTESPIISNGIELAAYFKELKTFDEALNVSIQNILFENSLIFPEKEEAEKQLREERISFDILGDSSKDILSFIKKLEESKRFVKVQQVTYRSSAASDGTGSYAYSATVIAQMYYLSLYETGKAN